MKSDILLLFVFFSCSSLYSQPGDLPKNHEPGKCYAKCLIPDQIETYEESYPVYIGDEDADIKLKTIRLQLKPENNRWEQKKQTNRFSSSSKEKLAWCLVNDPAEWVEITIVVDTAQTEDYVWETFTIQEMVKKNGFTEWYEVLCGDQVTHAILMEIQQYLNDNGYPVLDVSGIMGTQAKGALIAFQKHNNLPIGQLDKETLNMMGIHF